MHVKHTGQDRRHANVDAAPDRVPVFHSDPPPQATKAPFFFFHCDRTVGDNAAWTRLAELISTERPVFVLPPEEGDCDGAAGIPGLAAARLAKIRLRQPRGPYFLGGSGIGASIAFETASQLEAAGETVGRLLLVGGDASNLLFRRLRHHVARAGKMLRLDPNAEIALFLRLRNGVIHERKWRQWLFQAVFFGLLSMRAPFMRRAKARESICDSICAGEARKQLTVYERAFAAYFPGRCSARTILLCPAEIRSWDSMDPAVYWRRICDALEIYRLPGDRETWMTQETNLRSAAGIMEGGI